MKVLKIGLGCAPYYIAINVHEAEHIIVEAFGPEIELNDIGSKLEMEVIEISDEELENLPEFDGF